MDSYVLHPLSSRVSASLFRLILSRRAVPVAVCLTLRSVALLAHEPESDDATACLTRASVPVHMHSQTLFLFSSASASCSFLVTQSTRPMSSSGGRWPLLTSSPASYTSLVGLSHHRLVHIVATSGRCRLSPFHRHRPEHPHRHQETALMHPGPKFQPKHPPHRPFDPRIITSPMR